MTVVAITITPDSRPIATLWFWFFSFLPSASAINQPRKALRDQGSFEPKCVVCLATQFFHDAQEESKSFTLVVGGDRVAEELGRQLKTLPLNVTNTRADELADTIKSLGAENKYLKAELDEQSHIFSLQPYRKDLTPEEVGQDFDDLVNGVTDWVTKFMDPIPGDADWIEKITGNGTEAAGDACFLKWIPTSSSPSSYLPQCCGGS
ncbi:hypothetical protein VTK56DRAFT_8860 [Thermocarpiscus australiensis]